MTASTIAATVPAVAKLLTSRRATRKKTLDDPRYSQAYKNELLAVLTEADTDTLATLRATRDSAAATERAAISRARASTTTGDAALLAELRGERAWNRTVRRLDSGTNPLVLIQEAGKAGDRALLGILAEELPAYVESKGGTSQEINGYALAITQAAEPLKSDAERRLDTREAALDRAVYAADFALGHAEHELTTGQPAAVLLLADGGTVDLTPSDG